MPGLLLCSTLVNPRSAVPAPAQLTCHNDHTIRLAGGCRRVGIRPLNPDSQPVTPSVLCQQGQKCLAPPGHTAKTQTAIERRTARTQLEVSKLVGGTKKTTTPLGKETPLGHKLLVVASH